MPLTTLKIAVFAPMPMASVRSAIAVNIGERHNRRKMYLPMQAYTAMHGKSLQNRREQKARVLVYAQRIHRPHALSC